jgi:hypothetical protein
MTKATTQHLPKPAGNVAIIPSPTPEHRHFLDFLFQVYRGLGVKPLQHWLRDRDSGA